MPKQVEFFYDYASPATYLAYTQLPAIARRTGSTIVYKPFLLGGVFKASGNSSPMTVPAKAAWMLKDLERCARGYGVPLRFNPHFPVNTIQLMRGAIWAWEKGWGEAYDEVMFKAVWVDGSNLTDAGVVAGLLAGIDIDPTAFNAAVSDPLYKDKLKANTDEAVKRGAFGAPTLFVGGEMFWGQDRLHHVEAALKA